MTSNILDFFDHLVLANYNVFHVHGHILIYKIDVMKNHHN